MKLLFVFSFSLLFFTSITPNHKNYGFPINSSTGPQEIGNWDTTDWEIICFKMNESNLGDYYNSEDGDDCSYIKRADGSAYSITEFEKRALANNLKAASELLKSYHYEQPILDKENGKWKSKIFAPHCYCGSQVYGGCCKSIDRVTAENDTIYKFSNEGLFGLYRKDGLLVKARVDSSADNQFVSSAHELFHAVATNHLDNNKASLDSFKTLIETAWIFEGGAEGFGHFWGSRIGKSADREEERKFDKPLYTGEKGIDIGAQYSTSRFWEYVAERNNSYEFMRHILDQDFEIAQGKVKGAVYQVNTGLQEAGFGDGLFDLYKGFVREKLTNDDYFTEILEGDINTSDEEVIINSKPFRPISAQAFKFNINAQAFQEEDLDQKQVILKLKLKNESEQDIHMFFAKEEVIGEKSFDITKEFRQSLELGVPVQAKIYVANINLVAEETEEKPIQEIAGKVELLECPMLPKGLLNMVYESTDTKGEKSLRVIYKLNSTDGTADTQKGNMKMEMYSFAMDKTIADTDLDFECTSRGVVLQGPETIYLPEQAASFGFLDMTIATNTNIIPHRPEVGSSLDDAHVVVNAESTNDLTGLFFMSIDNHLTNRKVVKKENITVPAGTFECYRIEFSSQSRFEFSGAASFMNLFKRKMERASRSQNIIWVTENYGWVKQEISNSDGTSLFELMSLTEL